MHAGIDLGTSNSVVAVVEEGLPRVLPDEAGCITTPSWVTFTDVRCTVPLTASAGYHLAVCLVQDQ